MFNEMKTNRTNNSTMVHRRGKKKEMILLTLFDENKRRLRTEILPRQIERHAIDQRNNDILYTPMMTFNSRLDSRFYLSTRRMRMAKIFFSSSSLARSHSVCFVPNYFHMYSSRYQ